jgi:hypothetical protein
VWAAVGCSGEDAVGVSLGPTLYPANTRDMLHDPGQQFTFRTGAYAIETYLEGTTPCFMAGNSSSDTPVIPVIATYRRPYSGYDGSVTDEPYTAPRCASALSIFAETFYYDRALVQMVTADDMSGARAYMRVERLTYPAQVALMAGTMPLTNEGGYPLNPPGDYPVPLEAVEDGLVRMGADVSGNEYRVTRKRWLAVTLSLNNTHYSALYDYAAGLGSTSWGDRNPIGLRARLIHTKAPVRMVDDQYNEYYVTPDPTEMRLTDEGGARSLTWFVDARVGDTFGVRVSCARPGDDSGPWAYGNAGTGNSGYGANIHLFIRPYYY